MRGSTICHSSSVSGASSGAIAVVLGSPASVASGRSLSAEGAFGGSARLFAAGGNGLVRPSPHRPSELEDSLLLVRLGHGKQHAHLTSGTVSMGSDQHRDPLFITACVSAQQLAAKRVTTRKAWTSRQRLDAAIPAFPSPHFVVVHADLTLRFFKGTFYGPAILADPDQFLDGGILRAVGLLESEVIGVVGATAGQKPPVHPLLLRVYSKLQARPFP